MENKGKAVVDSDFSTITKVDMVSVYEPQLSVNKLQYNNCIHTLLIKCKVKHTCTEIDRTHRVNCFHWNIAVSLTDKGCLFIMF